MFQTFYSLDYINFNTWSFLKTNSSQSFNSTLHSRRPHDWCAVPFQMKPLVRVVLRVTPTTLPPNVSVPWLSTGSEWRWPSRGRDTGETQQQMENFSKTNYSRTPRTSQGDSKHLLSPPPDVRTSLRTWRDTRRVDLREPPCPFRTPL